ncbi:RNase H family protein [Hippea jasoniae]|uniref:RNase H family protein n=1 Tax=Hippea jasoniae TaxID=944479 RepID=UPI000558217E|nr:RNase H family protein [Hippea jasoniae]
MLEVYTDGSCIDKDKADGQSVGGWGVYIVFDKKSVSFSGYIDCINPAYVEFFAVLKAFEYIDFYLDEHKNIDFYVDCDYVVTILKELSLKKKITYKGKLIRQNFSLIKEIATYLDKFEITWHIVKSHRGNKGNEMADMLARKAAKQKIK